MGAVASGRDGLMLLKLFSEPQQPVSKYVSTIKFVEAFSSSELMHLRFFTVLPSQVRHPPFSTCSHCTAWNTLLLVITYAALV